MKIQPISPFTFNQKKHAGYTNCKHTADLYYKDSVAFGQSLIKTTPVRTSSGKISDLNFVEYKSEDYEKLALLSKKWGIEYISHIAESFENENKISEILPDANIKERIVGLENKNGEIEVIAQIVEIEGMVEGEFVNYLGIADIQANPKEMYQCPDKHYRGLGETLSVEIVKIAKSENRECVSLISANNNFWDSSGFFKDPNSCNSFKRKLEKNDFDKYINYVKNKLKHV